MTSAASSPSWPKTTEDVSKSSTKLKKSSLAVWGVKVAEAAGEAEAAKTVEAAKAAEGERIAGAAGAASSVIVREGPSATSIN